MIWYHMIQYGISISRPFAIYDKITHQQRYNTKQLKKNLIAAKL